MKQFFKKRDLRTPMKRSVVMNRKNDSTYGAPIVESEKAVEKPEIEKKAKPASGKKNNKKTKKGEDMNIDEQISAAEVVLDEIERPKKVVKKDRGLIERCESSKIILTEDNRQVLND